VLMLGYRQDGKMHRMAWTVQPGSDAVSPAGKTISLWDGGGRIGDRNPDTFFVVGHVDGTPAEITWSTPDGEQGTVDGMSTSVAPGHTVFYLTVPQPEGIADITFHSSDGWSCSLKDCGSVG
jgi:hypothetical protein